MPTGYRQVLDDVVTAVTGLPTTGSSVFEDPAVAIDKGSIPAVAIEAISIEPEIMGETHDNGSWRELHTFIVDITGLSYSIAERDQISFEILDGILRVGEPGRWRRLQGSEFVKRGEFAKRLYSVRHRFEIQYHILSTAPDVLIHEG